MDGSREQQSPDSVSAAAFIDGYKIDIPFARIEIDLAEHIPAQFIIPRIDQQAGVFVLLIDHLLGRVVRSGESLLVQRVKLAQKTWVPISSGGGWNCGQSGAGQGEEACRALIEVVHAK